MKKILPNQRRAWWAAAVLTVVSVALFPAYELGSRYLLRWFGGTETGFHQVQQWALVFYWFVAAVLLLVVFLLVRWHLGVFRFLQQNGLGPQALPIDRTSLKSHLLSLFWPILLANDQWTAPRKPLPSGVFLLVWGILLLLFLGLLVGCLTDLDLWGSVPTSPGLMVLFQPFLWVAYVVRVPLTALILFGMWRINRIEQQIAAQSPS